MASETHAMWTHEKTLALIASVEIYKDQLNHVTKRRHVWNNISNDLLSQDIVVSNENCKKKWLNLVRTYKTCKDVKGKTGRGPTRFVFFDQMEDILGKEPNFSSPHSINVGETLPFTSIASSYSIDEGATSSPSCSQQEIVVENFLDEELPPVERTTPVVTPKRQPKKFSNIKLRQEFNELKQKVKEKNELQKKKLELLERKLKLDERKVLALEKLAKISHNYDNL